MKSLRTFFQTYRKIKQKATAFSAVVVVFLFGLFAQAYMHDFNLVYITLFFVFSFAFSAAPIGILNLGRLSATFVHSGRFFAKQDGNISLKITNNSPVASWAITVHGMSVSKPLAKLNAGNFAIVHLNFTPKNRGSFSYKSCYMQSKYPLSTVRLTLPIDEHYEGIAYPEPKGKRLSSFLNEQEAQHGEEKEFDGLQTYDGTQKISYIHWASVAKGELSVKLFSKDLYVPNLIFDFHKAATNDEARLSQLCLWALECEKKHLPFSIKMPRGYLSSAKESIDEILSTLAKH
ncbi:MAG: hypothetical protein HF962_00975 [Sulfurovum sp.]|nr:hypothetical protein [Sulfurovum sp.]